MCRVNSLLFILKTRAPKKTPGHAWPLKIAVQLIGLPADSLKTPAAGGRWREISAKIRSKDCSAATDIATCRLSLGDGWFFSWQHVLFRLQTLFPHLLNLCISLILKSNNIIKPCDLISIGGYEEEEEEKDEEEMQKEEKNEEGGEGAGGQKIRTPHNDVGNKVICQSNSEQWRHIYNPGFFGDSDKLNIPAFLSPPQATGW